MAGFLLRNRECLLSSPGNPDPVAAGDVRGAAGSLRVLAADDQFAAGVQVHDVTRESAHVDDVLHAAALHVRALRVLLPVGEQRYLLRAHGYLAAVALDEVGDADEPGDERGPRPLVHLSWRADLLDAAAAQHRDPVAHR